MKIEQSLIALPDNRLHKRSRVIKDIKSPEFQAHLVNLQKIFDTTNLIGLSAVQIGWLARVFLTRIQLTKYRTPQETDPLRVYINPRIVNRSDEEIEIFEGCGSVDATNIFAPVKRSRVITVEAYNEEGRLFRLKCDGILARVILHEIDHLNGTLFVSKTSHEKMIPASVYLEKILSSSLHQENSRITLKEFELLQ